MNDLITVSHYLPIFSTIISAIFAGVILSRYRAKPQAKHLLSFLWVWFRPVFLSATCTVGLVINAFRSFSVHDVCAVAT